MASKTLLDELELPLAQCIDVEDAQSLVRHAVPGLDGDFLQRTGRRAARVAVTGVVAGPDSREGLEKLRDRLRGTEPVDFVADIATATRVTRVLVEALDVREVAGKPERFEYAFLLREYNPPPPPVVEIPPGGPGPVDTETGTLVVEVIVEGEPGFDMSRVTVSAEGPATAPISRVLATRENNLWTEEKLPPGAFTVRAVVASPALAAAGQGEVKAGQTAKVTLRLVRAAGVAKAFVVTFRFDSAFVEPCMRAVLRRAAAYAAGHPSEHLVVVGHTDKTGSDAYNQSLSERRARAVFACLGFGDGPARSADEWTAIRQPRTGGGVPSEKDDWGTREYQQMLQELGFYPGRIDGDHGPVTREAVRAFRCRKGLPPGTQMDDAVWRALIGDYLADRPPTVARDRLLPNCAATKLEWIGCGEQDPVKNTEAAHRPNRRVELLFVTDAALPCQVPVPDTWALPAPGHTAAEWCLGPGDKAKRACFVSRQEPAPPRWSVEPADDAVITAGGTITKEVERPDGTVDTVPAGGTRFVLVASDGEFKASELGSGEPAPAQAGADGSFSFAGKRGGVYVLEVQDTVLARLADAPAAPSTGPTVCKALLTASDRLDVVLLRDPVLREIRLPVIAHLMTALHPGTRAVRTCPEALNPAVTHPQQTGRDEAAVRALVDAANRIWGQARVRWELQGVVPESFATAGRDACHVSEDERNGIFAGAATPNVLNLFLFGSMEVRGEAGVHVVGKLVDGADVTIRTFEAVAMGDRILLKLFANADPVEQTPDGPESEVILAHELGHYLSLDHVTGSGPAAQRRLMLPSEAPDHRKLTSDEVKQARASENARDCGRISVEVGGAVRFGGAGGHRFVALRDAAAPPVTVDARVAPAQLNAAGSAFVMTGGDAGALPTQRLVGRAALARTEVIARWTAAGGAQQSESYAAVHVVDFDVAVDGARALGNGRFLAIRDATGSATVRAVVVPEPVSIPRDLAAWTGGEETPDPLRRRVPLAAAGETQVSVTVAGVTKTVTLVVSALSLKVRGAEATSPDQFAAAQDPAGQVEVEATFTPPVADDPPGLVQWTGGQPGPAPRIRIVSKQAVAITPVLAQVGGAQKQATINVVGFTLDVAGATRVGGPSGDHFVAVAAPGQQVTVTATLAPQPAPLPPVQFQGGQAVPGQPLERRVAAATAGPPVTVTATIAGTSHSVTIHVVSFELTVQNATALAPTGSGDFVAVTDAAAAATVTAVVTPALTPLPADLVTWDAATLAATTAGATPAQRTFPLAPARVVAVTGTVAGVARTVRVRVVGFTLEVQGAMRFGGANGDHFVVVAAPGQSVSVRAVVAPLPSPVPADLVRWQGGQAVPGDALQRSVPAAAAGPPVTVRATVGTTVRAVTLHVVTFQLTVQNAVQLLPLADSRFGTAQEAAAGPGQVVTVSAVITPPIASPPDDLVVWLGDPTTAAGPLQRTFTRDTVRLVHVVSAVGGTTREVVVEVMAFTVEVAPSVRAVAPAAGLFAAADAAPLLATAVLAPLNGQLPPNAVTWNAGTAVAGTQTERRFARAAAARFDVRATFGTSSRTVSVTVVQVEATLVGTPVAPPTTSVRPGLWDNAFDAAGTVLTGPLEANHFVGADTRHFFFRVRHPGAAGATVRLDWKTTAAAADDDAPANPGLDLPRAADGVFVSPAVMVVTSPVDKAQATNTGAAAAAGAPGGPGGLNHRLRQMTVNNPRRDLGGEVVAEYTPAGAVGVVARLAVQMFRRAPQERRRLPLQIFVLLNPPVGAAPPVPTATAAQVLGTDLQAMREIYARIGVVVETVVPPGTPPASVVTLGGDSMVLVTPPPGVSAAALLFNLNNAALDQEAILATANPGVANTVRVFYATSLPTFNNRGESWPDANFAARAQVGCSFISASTAGPPVLAHEVGHLLTNKSVAVNGGHYAQPAAPAGNRLFAARNLMLANPSNTLLVGDSLRLWNTTDANTQIVPILGSRFTRPF